MRPGTIAPVSPRVDLYRPRPLIIGLALLFSACAPDAARSPTAPPEIATANAARVSGIITTTIIPFVPNENPNAVYGRATAINEAGVVAGWKRGPGLSAFTWKDGVMTSLGVYFEPAAINRSGDIAGNASGGAVVWRNGTLTSLTVAGVSAFASAMNDKGQIVGSGRPAGSTASQAFLWEDGTFTWLGTLGGSTSAATSINKHGDVVGYSQLSGNAVTHAFLWERGAMTDLGTVFGGSSQAFGINDRGDIVGLTARPFTSEKIPFIWRDGVMTPLLSGQNPPDPALTALYFITGISNAGHVVGSRAIGCCDPRAFVWRDGVDIDLAGPLTFPQAVNSSGEIAGYRDGGPFGLPGAYLWTVGRHAP